MKNSGSEESLAVDAARFCVRHNGIRESAGLTQTSPRLNTPLLSSPHLIYHPCQGRASAAAPGDESPRGGREGLKSRRGYGGLCCGETNGQGAAGPGANEWANGSIAGRSQAKGGAHLDCAALNCPAHRWSPMDQRGPARAGCQQGSVGVREEANAPSQVSRGERLAET